MLARPFQARGIGSLADSKYGSSPGPQSHKFLTTSCITSYVADGTTVRMHTYSLHRDARNFSDPDRFWPERWLIADGLLPHPEGTTFTHNPNAFIPFSVGPYNCVGKNLAMLEMRTLVCHTMQKMEMRFAEGWDREQWINDLEDVFVTRIGQLPVVLSKRD